MNCLTKPPIGVPSVCSFDQCSFVLQLEVRECDTSGFVLFFQNCLVCFFFYCSITVVPISSHYSPLPYPSTTFHFQSSPLLSVSMGPLYMFLDLIPYFLSPIICLLPPYLWFEVPYKFEEFLCSLTLKNAIAILMRFALNMYITLGNMTILTMLILSLQKHVIYFNFFWSQTFSMMCVVVLV